MKQTKTYYWKSYKDGMYYAVKLLNTNQKLKTNNFEIIGLSHHGFLTKYRKEKDGDIITLNFDASPTYTNLHLLMIDDIVKMVRSRTVLDFSQKLIMIKELREILEDHPDKYLKYIDVLSSDTIFNGILAGKYHLV